MRRRRWAEVEQPRCGEEDPQNVARTSNKNEGMYFLDLNAISSLRWLSVISQAFVL